MRIDGSAPTVTISSPANGGQFQRGEAATVDYACADHGSAIATCTGTVADGAALPTGTTGTHTIAVTATDGAGNATTATATYSVVDQENPAAHLDALVARVRSLGLSRARATALEAPLLVAKLGAAAGSRTAACTSMAVFNVAVDTYAALRWISSAQARDLRTGSAAVRSALGC